MALTLVEAAKLETGDVKRRAIIELYARNTDVLMALPFDNIAGNALSYNLEETLPGISFRGVNEAFTEDAGVINPVTENLSIAGGDLDVDRFIVETMGASQRSIREAMKVKSLALTYTKKFIKGDNGSDPREFDGLQTRLTGSQVISAGTTANGAALSLAKLDQLLDAVEGGANALLMNKAMRRRLTTAARTTSVGGYVQYTQDSFGRRQTTYNDIPILIVDQDSTGTDILGFTEASDSGTATSTSIYAVNFAPGMVSGIQNGGISVRDLGELDAKPVWRTRVEWFTGLTVMHPRAAARLKFIGDLAVVA
jgi:hypothetical protein